MTPHQYWNVCGLKKTTERKNQAKLSSLFQRAQIKSQENSFQPWPTLFRKVVHSPHSSLLTLEQEPTAHNRNEGTPSFRRRHKMFNKTELLKRSSSSLEKKRGYAFLPEHLSQLQLVAKVISPHPSPLLSKPVHGERKACLM